MKKIPSFSEIKTLDSCMDLLIYSMISTFSWFLGFEGVEEDVFSQERDGVPDTAVSRGREVQGDPTQVCFAQNDSFDFDLLLISIIVMFIM